MLERNPFDEVTSKLSKAVPESLRGAQEDVSKTVRASIQGAMNKLDLVSREEYEVQAKVLARTREKLERLEARVIELEKKLDVEQSTEE